MNATRMALLAVGAALIITALAVGYYRTPLRNQMPEGAAIAILLAVTGLFALGFSQEFYRERHRVIETVEHHEHAGARTARPARPVGTAGTRDVHESDTHEEIEVVEND